MFLTWYSPCSACCSWYSCSWYSCWGCSSCWRCSYRTELVQWRTCSCTNLFVKVFLLFILFVTLLFVLLLIIVSLFLSHDIWTVWIIVLVPEDPLWLDDWPEFWLADHLIFVSHEQFEVLKTEKMGYFHHQVTQWVIDHESSAEESFLKLPDSYWTSFCWQLQLFF